MEAGRIVQAATPAEFFGDEADARIRKFLKQAL
jgi:ABC-type polar amino acid transport system ATPase subunit